MSFVQLEGHWKECLEQDVPYDECSEESLVDSREPSLFVTGISRKDAEHLMELFDQDAIIFSGPETQGEIVLVFSDGKEEYLGEPSPGELQQAYSKYKNQAFTFMNERLEQKDFGNFCKVVADVYDASPLRTPEAEQSYGVLKNAVKRFFRLISSKVRVEFVDGDPYKSAEEMIDQVKRDKVLKVMKDYSSDHPVFTEEENWMFRAVHDWFSHILAKQPFTQKGEMRAYNTHAKMFPPDALPALFTEIIGQACYATTYGKFPTQKVVILPGFDYKNPGKILDRAPIEEILSSRGVSKL